HGGRTSFNGTNVVFSNGDVDPWSPLGVTERGNLDESIVPIVIKGTSHCADFYAAEKSDPPQLTATRATILENIK
ncbi:hypothetical protein PFISCL1PPCAC_13275, partial [Pristionchus fissidentatus]